MATATTEAPAAAAAAAETKGGGMKKILIIVVVLVVVGGAVYWFFLKPKPVATSWPAPVAGTVVTMDPVTINLSGTHYLKLGLAVQFSKAAGEETDGSKALDLAISRFSGMTVEELSEPETREKAKEALVVDIVHAYDETGETEHAAAVATAMATAKTDAEAQAVAKKLEEGSDTEETKTKYAEVLSRTGAYDVYFTQFVTQ